MVPQTNEQKSVEEIDEMIKEKIERIRTEYNDKIEELNVEIFE